MARPVRQIHDAGNNQHNERRFHFHVRGRPGSMIRDHGIAELEARMVWGRLLGEAAER